MSKDKKQNPQREERKESGGPRGPGAHDGLRKRISEVTQRPTPPPKKNNE